MLILRQIFSFLELLHKETSSKQLCAGFVLGMFLGFTPTLTLHWFLGVLVLILFRINIGATLLSWSLFKVLAFLADPLFDEAGLYFLTDIPPLNGLWVFLSRVPLFPYSRFNNSIVMGSFLFFLILAVPLFFLSKYLVDQYRQIVVRRVRASIVWRTWTASKLYRLYAKYQELKS